MEQYNVPLLKLGDQRATAETRQRIGGCGCFSWNIAGEQYAEDERSIQRFGCIVPEANNGYEVYLCVPPGECAEVMEMMVFPAAIALRRD